MDCLPDVDLPFCWWHGVVSNDGAQEPWREKSDKSAAVTAAGKHDILD
jgi:hypothetical protein